MHVVEDWGLLVRRFRVLHGLTQESIGDMFGVSQRTVSRWERRENKPSAQCLRRLRELARGQLGDLPESPVASIGHSLISGELSRAGNIPPQARSRRDDMLQEDHMPIALADRVTALLGHLAREDIERMTPVERRRLADLCRHVARLAEPGTSGDASARGDKCADPEQDRDDDIRTRRGRGKG